MLTIDFLTDYVCPFCLVTKENLRAALKTLHQEAEIIEHPYALTPRRRRGDRHLRQGASGVFRAAERTRGDGRAEYAASAGNPPAPNDVSGV